MTLDLTEQIAQLEKEKRRPTISLQGLIDCSNAYRATTGSVSTCQSISLLGDGSYNVVYRLTFDDGVQLAASVSSGYEEDFNPQARQSEIDTMKFVRESGLYPDVPIPNVHAWNITFNNPVGAPYIFMDVVQGKILETRDFRALTPKQQLSVVKCLAKLKASLSKPVPFDTLGSIIANASGGGFSLGPLASLSLECRGGPFKSADEMWRSYLEEAMLVATQEWCTIEKAELPQESSRPIYTYTPHQFTELYQLISALIPQFSIPQGYDNLVLHHPDIAFRNILFDEESISSDQPKISGVLDWAGAKILPLMLTAMYPDDLITATTSPFTRCSLRHETWRTIPHDWTFAGDKTQWPKTFTRTISGADIRLDYTPLVTAAIRAFYLRAHFSACYAEQMHLLHGDASLSHATLFADAPYYLKFHEAVRNGWEHWFTHEKWIRETYWRLRNLGGQETGKGLLIIGPNIYRASAEASVRNLEIPGDVVKHEPKVPGMMIDGVFVPS